MWQSPTFRRVRQLFAKRVRDGMYRRQCSVAWAVGRSAAAHVDVADTSSLNGDSGERGPGRDAVEHHDAQKDPIAKRRAGRSRLARCDIPKASGGPGRRRPAAAGMRNLGDVSEGELRLSALEEARQIAFLCAVTEVPAELSKEGNRGRPSPIACRTQLLDDTPRSPRRRPSHHRAQGEKSRLRETTSRHRNGCIEGN